MFLKTQVFTAVVFTFTPALVAESIVDCSPRRITVGFDSNEGQMNIAASFQYDVYTENPKKREDLLSSSDLMKQFKSLPEKKRLQYPEYIAIKDFEYRRSGDLDQLLALVEPGHSREKQKELLSNLDHISKFLQSFTEVVFCYKVRFGPYTGVSYFWRQPPDEKHPKGKGFPVFSWFKRINKRYMITKDIGWDSPYARIFHHYGARTILEREKLPINVDTSGMHWMAWDVDMSPPPEN
jgi:hypothetical protein